MTDLSTQNRILSPLCGSSGLGSPKEMSSFVTCRTKSKDNTEDKYFGGKIFFTDTFATLICHETSILIILQSLRITKVHGRISTHERQQMPYKLTLGMTILSCKKVHILRCVSWNEPSFMASLLEQGKNRSSGARQHMD